MKKLKKLFVPIKKVGDKKWIIRDGSEPDEIVELEVIGFDHHYDEYLVKIPESVAGYKVSQFHILHFEVSEKLLGQRFNSFYDARKDSSRGD